MSGLLFNTVPQKALEDDIPRWQKKKGMGIYLSDNDHDCLTNMRFADGVLLFASSKEQRQKMLCEFKKSTEKSGTQFFHPRKTKILSNQSSNTRKEIEVDNTTVEIPTKREILGPEEHFPATGDDRNQKSNQGCLGDVSQVQTGTDIEKKKKPAQTSTLAVSRSDNSDGMLRSRNMDTHQRARKNDTVDDAKCSDSS